MLLALETTTTGMLRTVAFAIFAGVVLIVLARRFNLPAIVLLLAGGVLLGPEVWPDGLAPVQPGTLGDGLGVIVSLAVGIILFEGGLTLDQGGYRSSSTVIRRLLSIGVLVTWLGTALAIWLVFDEVNAAYATLAGSLVIVTGPTVIAPLLKRIKVSSRLHSILHWEGVLIDPIGVFIALLCYEWVVEGGEWAAIGGFALRTVAGLGLGFAGGMLLWVVTRLEIVPEEMVNVFALAVAVLIFGLADLVKPETGLLAVTVAGFVFGLTKPRQLKQIRRFKAELTDLLIGVLFILLASRLSFAQFRAFGWEGGVVVAIVLLLVRPASVMLCALMTDLNWRERAFLSWVAPRGIVAASMASLIQLGIDRRGEMTGWMVDARFVETFTYSIIIATILLQGLSAGALAKLLQVRRPEPTGWLIVGAGQLARRLAGFLARTGEVRTVIVDTNARAISAAQADSLVAIVADARDTKLHDRLELQEIGNVLSLTDNEDLNHLVCEKWAEVVGPDHVFRCNPPGNAGLDEEETGGRPVWPRLPKPSLISAELERGDAQLVVGSSRQTKIAPNAIPLVRVSGRAVTFDPEREAEEGEKTEKREDGTTLFLHRKAQYLVRSARPELVVRSRATALETLFGELVDHVLHVEPRLPREELVKELLERETSFPTAIGEGVAAPHAYSSSLPQRLCVVAQVPDGIDFKAPDGEPVKLVFLVLSPLGDPEGHLATLAEIARIVIDPDRRTRLVTAPSPLDVMQIIREADEE